MLSQLKSSAERASASTVFISSEEALSAARDQQSATGAVLALIAASPVDVQPVFEAIAESALRRGRLVIAHVPPPIGCCGQAASGRPIASRARRACSRCRSWWTAIAANHPVAEAIGDYFGVPTEEILDQHQEGLGFGEIARAYFLARELAADDDPSNDLSADAILDMHQAGAGWGQIIQTLGLPNGNRARNLGQIMSGRARRSAEDSASESTSAAPAQNDHPSKTKVDKLKDYHPNANTGNRSSSGNHGSSNGGKGGKSEKPKKGK